MVGKKEGWNATLIVDLFVLLSLSLFQLDIVVLLVGILNHKLVWNAFFQSSKAACQGYNILIPIAI